jgi:hypothetical protein
VVKDKNKSKRISPKAVISAVLKIRIRHIEECKEASLQSSKAGKGGEELPSAGKALNLKGFNSELRIHENNFLIM